MALPDNADVVVVRGFWWDEATGQGVNGTVTFEPVRLTGNASVTPNLRDLAASGYVKTRARIATPNAATGYFATFMVASNDPDLDAYGGRRVTFSGETSFVVEVPHNAPTTTVDAAMATATGLAQGSTVKAIWLSDAALASTPTPPAPVNYLTSEQTLANLADAVEAHDQDTSAHPDLRAAAVGKGSQSGLITAMIARAAPAITGDVPELATFGPGGPDPISGGVFYPHDTAAITSYGCVPTVVNQYDTDYIQNFAKGVGGSGAPPWSIEFNTSSAELSMWFRPAIEVFPWPRFWVWIDNQPTTVAPVAFSDATISSGSLTYLHVVFGDTRPRRIRIYMAYADFGGITVTTGNTVTASTPQSQLTAVMYGDSWFGEQAGTTIWPDTVSASLGATLGWGTYLAGVGGSGYVNGDPPFTDSTRLAQLYAAEPDYVIINGSINDTEASGVQSAAASVYSAIATNLPDAKVIVVGPQPVPADAYMTFTALLANRDAVRTAALAAPNVIGFIDPIAGQWLSGSGNIANPTEDGGNADFYVAPDNLHPTQLGAWYYSRRLAEEVLRVLIKESLPYQ